jgi:lysozyme
MTSALLGAVLPTLIREEGFRRKPYRCPSGALTIGYGTNLDAGLDDEEAMFLLEHRINKAISGCLAFPWFARLDAVRQAVVVMMAYQLGVDGVAEFTDMCAALERPDFESAADAMQDSKWARVDSPARAYRLARAMRVGRFV